MVPSGMPIRLNLRVSSRNRWDNVTRFGMCNWEISIGWRGCAHGRGFVSRKASIVGFVFRIASIVELERIEEVGEFESVLKTKGGGDGKREPENEDEKGIWEVR